jgi:ADP-heptose:LPS heptosyltransferase
MSSSPKILIIKRRYLGDIVLLSRLITSLRTFWPKANICILVDPAYADILKLNKQVDDIIIHRGGVGLVRTAFSIYGKGFTHVLDLDNRRDTAFLTRLSRAKIRVGLHHGPAVLMPDSYSDLAIAPAEFFEAHHISDFYGYVLTPIKIALAPVAQPLQPLPADVEMIRELPEFHSTATPRLLIHPGSRSHYRLWPGEFFAEVCDQISSSGIASVTLVGGATDQDFIDNICALARSKPLRISRFLTTSQLAALFSQYDRVLCHDSGPMHVAAAMGTPVVALFGSQSVQTWRPIGDHHRILQAPLPCQRCVAPASCEPSDSYRNYCVRNIPVSSVLDALKSSFAAE